MLLVLFLWLIVYLISTRLLLCCYFQSKYDDFFSLLFFVLDDRFASYTLIASNGVVFKSFGWLLFTISQLASTSSGFLARSQSPAQKYLHCRVCPPSKSIFTNTIRAALLSRWDFRVYYNRKQPPLEYAKESSNSLHSTAFVYL